MLNVIIVFDLSNRANNKKVKLTNKRWAWQWCERAAASWRDEAQYTDYADDPPRSTTCNFSQTRRIFPASPLCHLLWRISSASRSPCRSCHWLCTNYENKWNTQTLLNVDSKKSLSRSTFNIDKFFVHLCIVLYKYIKDYRSIVYVPQENCSVSLRKKNVATFF